MPDLWDGSWLDDMSDPIANSEDVERFVRSRADETLADEPRAHLEGFVDWVIADDARRLLDALPDSSERGNVRSALPSAEDGPPSLRHADVARPMYFAVHLLRLAEKVAG